MALIDAGRAIAITQTTITPTAFIESEPTGFWLGFPYRWQVELSVIPTLNSGATPNFQYGANEIEIGDWVTTTSGGVAVKIVEILEVVSSDKIVVIVEDEDLYNILSDPNFTGTGIGQDGPGLVFPVDPISKLPVLGPVPSYYLDVNAQMDLFARFIQQGKLKSGGALVEVPTDGELKDGVIKGWQSNQTTVTDALDQLNFLLDKALPNRPTDVADIDIVMANRELPFTGVRLAEGAITNNIPNSTYAFGDLITAIRGTSAQTELLNDFGPGDIGTLSFSVNGTLNSETILTKDDNTGIYDNLAIISDYDFPAGITTWKALGVILNGTVPDGINQFSLSHSISGTTTKDFVVEPLTDLPLLDSFSVVPLAPVIRYVSGVPHYTAGTTLSYDVTASKIVGRTFPSEKMMGVKTLPDIGSASVDFGNAKLPTTLTINHGPIVIEDEVVTLSEEQAAGEVELTVYANNTFNFAEEPITEKILYSSGDQMFLVETPTAQSTQAGIKRVALPDTTRPEVNIIDWATDWNSGSAGNLGDLQSWEAPIIGGTAFASRTNYSVGYLPAGPDFTTKPVTQFISFKIQRITNRLKLEILGSYSGVYIKLPGISNDMPNAINGWWDGSKQANHAPLYWPGHPTASDGCLLNATDDVTEFTFGNISSAYATDNIILIRFVLTGNDEIRSIRIVD